MLHGKSEYTYKGPVISMVKNATDIKNEGRCLVIREKVWDYMSYKLKITKHWRKYLKNFIIPILKCVTVIAKFFSKFFLLIFYLVEICDVLQIQEGWLFALSFFRLLHLLVNLRIIDPVFITTKITYFHHLWKHLVTLKHISIIAGSHDFSLVE